MIVELYHDDYMYEYLSIVMTVMSFLISLIFVFSQDRVITWGGGFCDSSVVQDQLQGKGANPISLVDTSKVVKQLDNLISPTKLSTNHAHTQYTPEHL